jgi:predicted O-methyltransferase YrrM
MRPHVTKRRRSSNIPDTEPARSATPVALVNALLRNIGIAGRNLVGPLLVPGASRALRHAAAEARTVEAAVDLVFRFRHCGIRIAPGQIPSEITQLLHILSLEPPRCVLEIGTAGGGSFFLFSRVAAPEAHLVSVDLPLGPFGGGYPEWRGKLIRACVRPGQRADLIRADSHAPETFRAVKDHLGGRPVDFLFIDGDHRYEGVKGDFETYATLVRPGGWIGFHDIVPGPAQNAGEVSRFWNELKATRTVTEYVADWNQQGYGIGLLKHNG